MLSVGAALSRIFDLVTPLESEKVALAQSAGRVLAESARADRDQPPFAASAMDGYAVQGRDVAPGAVLDVIGVAAAGHRFSGRVGRGQAVRISTGAPVPEGADRIVIQEDVSRNGEQITLASTLDDANYIRPAGGDFTAGTELSAPRRLQPSDLAMLAAMNAATVTVSRRPVVALIATGDELVMPGEAPGPDQIIASNSLGLMALAQSAGAKARILPIARDNAASIATALELVSDADLIVTIGGASVGDHDLVADVAASRGLERAFYRVAMRPGKPLMAGRLGQALLLGVPGNPVSSMVCGHVFMVPALHAMQGLGCHPAPRSIARLSGPLAANGPREHYMRAHVEGGRIRAFERQDSALLSVLSAANALLVRPPKDSPRAIGDTVKYILL
ncbi:MAG: molybdopterin molybdotransferase MoeA [Paracoccaceae bacterium]